LQNKVFKATPNETTNYDVDTYLKAMKRFQKETRGIVRDSSEYTEIRNNIYRELD
jgi:hypothetical protein